MTNKKEFTGKDVNYYVVDVPEPKRLSPYVAECEDIIEALGMTFSEGCEFKALWRSCAARTLGKHKEGMDEDGIYDAEKQEYYARRTLVVRKRLKEKRLLAVKAEASRAQGRFAPIFDEIFVKLGLKDANGTIPEGEVADILHKTGHNAPIQCDGKSK